MSSGVEEAAGEGRKEEEVDKDEDKDEADDDKSDEKGTKVEEQGSRNGRAVAGATMTSVRGRCMKCVSDGGRHNF